MNHVYESKMFDEYFIITSVHVEFCLLLLLLNYYLLDALNNSDEIFTQTLRHSDR